MLGRNTKTAKPNNEPRKKFGGIMGAAISCAPKGGAKKGNKGVNGPFLDNARKEGGITSEACIIAGEMGTCGGWFRFR